jgi:hypothetical protein
VAFNHSVWSFPFGIKLPFSGISGHYLKFSEYPISDSEFPGVNRLVIVLGHLGPNKLRLLPVRRLSVPATNRDTS